jgi:hypothetical protein
VRIPKNFKHLVKYSNGYREQGFVEFVDFGPTLLNLVGIELPNGVDGFPFMGRGSKTRSFTFNYADRFDEKYDFVRWLRKGKFSYQRNYQSFNFDGIQNDYRYKQLAFTEWRNLYNGGRLNPIQSQFFRPRSPEALYDISNDPYETNNLAIDPKYQKTLSEMRDLLRSEMLRTNDLSFYPEPVMIEKAMSNPVNFGKEKSENIKRMSEIADLQLLPISKIKEPLEKALNSRDPWIRYWACIVASSHIQIPEKMIDRIKVIARSDSESLVRTRAAEFLGIAKKDDPFPIIKQALKMAGSDIETNLILNTAVLLQDGGYGYNFESLSMSDVNHKGRYVEARIAYLSERKK